MAEAATIPNETTFDSVRYLFDLQPEGEFTLADIREAIPTENPIALAAATGRLSGEGFLRCIRGESGRGKKFVPDRYVRAAA